MCRGWFVGRNRILNPVGKSYSAEIILFQGSTGKQLDECCLALSFSKLMVFSSEHGRL